MYNKTSSNMNQTNNTSAETAYIHLGDVREVISKIREKIDFYKSQVEELRLVVTQSEDQIKNSHDELNATLAPAINKTKKNLHVAIVTQREENEKLQQQIIQLKKEKAELVQNIINLKKKTDELQKDLGKYPGRDDGAGGMTGGYSYNQ